ncbi:hypothetical protein BH23GEM3_BH23GEM3_21740 [soil metagenome]|nr:hypothetical protein [Gemmatimonadota bacterium]
MTRILVCLIAVSLCGVQAVDAQRTVRRPQHPARIVSPAPPLEFGVRGGYDFDENLGSAGAQIRIPLAHPIQLVPSGDVFFADARTQWQINTDLVFRPLALGGLYGGVGAAFVSREFDAIEPRETRAGYNLVAGLRGNRLSSTSVNPFVEARWTAVDDYSPFRLTLGVDVPVTDGRRR